MQTKKTEPWNRAGYRHWKPVSRKAHRQAALSRKEPSTNTPMDLPKIEQDYLRLQRDRAYAVETIVALAMELVHPKRGASKEQIAESIEEAAKILQSLDRDILNLADKIDIKILIKLING